MFLIGITMACGACGLNRYNLSLSVTPDDSGTVTPEKGAYTDGTEIELTAVPSKGYIFDHWSGDVTGESSKVTVVMDGEKNITAHFMAGWSDSRIRVIRDIIEKSASFPDELKIAGYYYKEPEEGFNYLLISLTVDAMENGRIPVLPDLGLIDAVLFDKEAREYKAVLYNIRYGTPQDSSESEDLYVTAGSKLMFLFVVPEDSEPSEFSFSYQFQEPGDTGSSEWYDIDIELDEGE